MALIPEIDEQTSRDNARAVLKQYRRYSRMAGRALTDIQSPTIDDMPKATHYENRQEVALTETFNAQIEFEACQQALARLPFVSYWTLYYSYCTPYQLSGNEIAERIGVANDDAVDYLKRRALIEFAEAYKGGVLLKFTF